MRVLYLVHQYLPRYVGGTEIYTHGLARRAVAAGFEVAVVAYHESPSPSVADFGVVRRTYEGIPVREVHYNLSVAPDPARYEHENVFVGDLVRRELEDFRPEVVHVMHAMKLSGAALDACRARGVPFIVTLCDFWFICPRHTLVRSDGRLCDGPAHRLDCVRCLHDTHGFVPRRSALLSERRLLRRMRRGRRRREREPAALWRDLHAIRRRNRYLARRLLAARRIIALSGFQKAVFVRNGLPAERVEVIEHGLEAAGLRPGLRRPGPVPRVVFIGSIVPDKGPHVLLEALARIPTLAVECRIYGAVPGTAYGRHLAALAAADPRVSLRGSFPPDGLGAVLAETDLLAVPSVWYENSPLVVKAAFHVGVPVLASRIGSLAEMVTPGRNGWLEVPGDPARWAAAIARLAADRAALAVDPTPVKSMDENAREMFAIYASEAGRP